MEGLAFLPWEKWLDVCCIRYTFVSGDRGVSGNVTGWSLGASRGSRSTERSGASFGIAPCHASSSSIRIRLVVITFLAVLGTGLIVPMIVNYALVTGLCCAITRRIGRNRFL